MQQKSVSLITIIKLAIPLILANCLVPIIGLINTAIVGHLNTPTILAAVALGVTIFDFFLGVFNFLRMSTTGLVAQHLQQEDQVVLILVRGLLLSLIISVILIGAQWPLRQIILLLIHTTPAIKQQVEIYFNITIWMVPLELMLYVVLGWLIAMKQTQRALVLTMCTLFVTAPTAWGFVYLAHWGAAGVACADVLATLLTCVLGLYWVWQKYNAVLLTLSYRDVWCWQKIKPLLAFNGNVFIRTLLLLSCFSFFTLQSSRFGSIVLAANAVLMDIQIFSAYFLDGIANITESFVGEAVGLQQAIANVLKSTAAASLLVALLLSLVLLAFGREIITMLTSISSVAQTAQQYVTWIIILPIIGVGSYWLDGVFVGAAKSSAMRNTMIFAAGVYFATWYLTHSWGNMSLWIAICVFLLARAFAQLVLLLIWLRRGQWQSIM